MTTYILLTHPAGVPMTTLESGIDDLEKDEPWYTENPDNIVVPFSIFDEMEPGPEPPSRDDEPPSDDDEPQSGDDEPQSGAREGPAGGDEGCGDEVALQKGGGHSSRSLIDSDGKPQSTVIALILDIRAGCLRGVARRHY